MTARVHFFCGIFEVIFSFFLCIECGFVIKMFWFMQIFGNRSLIDLFAVSFCYTQKNRDFDISLSFIHVYDYNQKFLKQKLPNIML